MLTQLADDYIRLSRLNPDDVFALDEWTMDCIRRRGLLDLRTLSYRNRWLAVSDAKRLGLPEPFPAYPYKGPVAIHFAFRCEFEGRFMMLSFHAAYAAKHFINTLLHGLTFKQISNDVIRADNGLTIKGEWRDCLNEVLEHKLTENELKWRAPEPYPYYWARFLGKRELPALDYMMPPQLMTGGEQREARPVVVKRRERTQEEKKTVVRAKIKGGDYITIGQIADELKTQPRVLRGILRDLKQPKPEHGWAWPPSEAEKIKSKLKSRLR